MLRYTDFIGLPTIVREKGYQLGSISDVLIYPNSNEVAGLQVNLKKHLNHHVSFVKFSNIFFSQDSVLIDLKTCIKFKQIENNNLYKLNDLLKKRIIDESGKSIGILTNYIFNCDFSEVIMYEISDGLINDVRFGRKLVPTFDIISQFSDFIILSKQSLEESRNY